VPINCATNHKSLNHREIGRYTEWVNALWQGLLTFGAFGRPARRVRAAFCEPKNMQRRRCQPGHRRRWGAQLISTAYALMARIGLPRLPTCSLCAACPSASPQPSQRYVNRSFRYQASSSFCRTAASPGRRAGTTEMSASRLGRISSPNTMVDYSDKSAFSAIILMPSRALSLGL
jgi:hypothetical protein